VSPTKILIIDAYTDGNIGSGALVENSVDLLKRYFRDAQIRVMAQFPDHIGNFTGLHASPELILMPFKKPRSTQLLWLVKTAVWMGVHALALGLGRWGVTIRPQRYTRDNRRLRALEEIAGADLVASVGAERINDNFYQVILFALYMLWVVQVNGKFLVLFPQTIGPFHFRLTRFLSKKILSGCDLIYLRDARSMDTVRELGVTKPPVLCTCDVALLQPAAPRARAESLLAEAGVPFDGKSLVGISAMRWDYFKAQGKSRYQDYRKAIARVADDFIENRDARILFLATNVPVHGCRENDVEVAEEIRAHMRNPGRAYLISRLCTPAEMKSIMGLLEICLVTRMHACIFATGIFTPTFSINYQFKLKEYMSMMGLGEYTIDIDEVTYEGLHEISEKAWKNRKEMRAKLVERIAFWRGNLESEMTKLELLFNGNARSKNFQGD
jgi:polysaccharide pyruvyl transferase WcaK-like protein